MNVRILHMIEGARQATGVAVIIDVFRAFTVEAWLAAKGAERIIPVGDMDIAYRFKEEHPDCILVGERHGVKLPGFDFGNSPSRISQKDFTGKTIVHTTSAGTQGIANAVNADVVLTGSLVNAGAIARYIKKEGFQDVSLVCMGLEGVSQIEEDNLCAEYIKGLLLGYSIDLDGGIEDLKHTSGAKFFDEKQQDVFPMPDFRCSVDVDRFDFVLRLVKNPAGLDYMEVIEVEK